MSKIWGALFIIGVLVSLLTGRGETIIGTLTESAGSAVTLCLTLAGAYVLWLGLMGIAERSGLTRALAKRLRPVLRFLFPGVPDGHLAQAMISMNLSANILGMGTRGHEGDAKAQSGAADGHGRYVHAPDRQRFEHPARADDGHIAARGGRGGEPGGHHARDNRRDVRNDAGRYHHR